MANRFWVGGNAAWDATASTKWALTSGGAGGQAVPSSSDDVFLDNGTGHGNVTIQTATANCKSLTCTGYVGTLTVNQTLTVTGGSMLLVAGMTFTATSAVTFTGTASVTLTTAGKTFTSITKNGTGTLTLQDNLSCGSGVLTLTQGTLDCNGKNITAGKFSSSNSNTRALTMGAGTWTLSDNGLVWNTGTTTGLTISGASAIVNSTYAGGVSRTFSVLGYNGAFNVTAGNGVIANFSGISAKSIDFTGYAGAVGTNVEFDFSTSIVFSTGMTMGSGAPASMVVFNGAGAGTLTTNGITLNSDLTMTGAGTLTLQDDTNLGIGTFHLDTGTLNANNKNITCASVSSLATANLTMGSGTWTINGQAQSNPIGVYGDVVIYWNTAPGTLTVTANTSTIKLVTAGMTTNLLLFIGGENTFNNIWWAPGTTTSNTLAVLDSNTFNDFKYDGTGTGNTLAPASFEADGVTQCQQLVTTFTVSGISGAVLKLRSFDPNTLAEDPGNPHFLVDGSGTNACDYLDIKDSHATGGATWQAGSHSTDSGGNAVWIFSGGGTKAPYVYKRANRYWRRVY